MSGVPQPYFQLPKHFSAGKKLGRGASADVYLGYDKTTKEPVAIKVVSKKTLTAATTKYLTGEIRLMRSLQDGHDNVIKLFDVAEDEHHVFLVLEYCAGGDLRALIDKHKRFDETVARHFLVQLAEGMMFLEQHKIVHRDLKPQNILLTAQSLDATLKVADLGYSRTLDSSTIMMNSFLGSPLYMAPELLSEQPYDKKSDMWSVGVILFDMIYGHSPWPNVKTPAQLQAAHRRPTVYPNTVSLSSACKDCMVRLLQVNRDFRITLPELLQHSFVHGYATVQVRHVTTLRKATNCPSSEIDVPSSNGCKVDDIVTLLAAKFNVPIQEQIVIAGPPALELKASADDIIEFLDLDASVGSAKVTTSNLTESYRRSQPIAELLSGDLLSSYQVVEKRRPLYLFDRRELANAAIDPEGFQFVPLPIQLTSKQEEMQVNEAEPLGELLEFHRQFEANFRQEQTLKRVCDFTFQQCRLCIGQLHVLGRAPRIATQAALTRYEMVHALYEHDQETFAAAREKATALAAAGTSELQRLQALHVPAELTSNNNAKRALASYIDVKTYDAAVQELHQVNAQLASIFGALHRIKKSVSQAAEAAEAAGQLDLRAYGERLREAHAWCGEVRTYYQVFQKHYETVNARVEREKRQVDVGGANALGWSLISDGFQQIGDIHQAEVDASEKYLQQLNNFQDELVRYMKPVASRVQPILHGFQSQMNALAKLAHDHKLTAKLLTRRAALLTQLEPLMRIRSAYANCLREAVRRQRFEQSRAKMLVAARKAFGDAAAAECAQRQAFALMHATDVVPALFAGFEQSAPRVATPQVCLARDDDDEANDDLTESQQQRKAIAPTDNVGWRRLTVETAKAARLAALDEAERSGTSAHDLDDAVDEEFERIERGVQVQDGAVRLLQLEHENRRLRAVLQQLATRDDATTPAVQVVLAQSQRRDAPAPPADAASSSSASSASSTATANTSSSPVSSSQTLSMSSSGHELDIDFGKRLSRHHTQCVQLGKAADELARQASRPAAEQVSVLDEAVATLRAKHDKDVAEVEAHIKSLPDQDEAREAAVQLRDMALSILNEIVVVQMQLDVFK